MSDIIAENQTEAVLSVLDRGEADNATRDKVSAALLRTQMKLLEDFAEVKDHLWKPRDLEEFVDARHRLMCQTCPAKLAAQPVRKKASILEMLCSSESIRYFLLVIILIWAVIYMKAGPDGVAAVRDAALSVTK